MMFQTMSKPQIERLTKKLAHEFRDMEPCPNDRPLSPRRVEFIKGLVKSSEFRVAEWCSCYCDETSKTYRVNGKHTSVALSDLLENGSEDKAKEVRIIRTIYRAKTLEGVAKLYASFDSRMSARSTSDINRVYAQCDDRLSSISTKVINLCVTACAAMKWGTTHKDRILPEDRAQEMLLNADFVVWYDSILSGAHSIFDAKGLRRSPAAAAMLQTYRKAPEKAAEFWSAVRDASDPAPDSVTRTLNKFLLVSSVNLGSGARSTKHIVTVKEMFDKCIHAWNAWRDGKTSILLKFLPDSPSPKAK